MMKRAVACLVIFCASLVAEAGQTPLDYSAHVAPLLKKYCVGCHNDGDREGELSLESYTALRKGSTKHLVVVPGDPGASRLLRVLTGTARPAMPPEGEPQPAAAEIELLKSWIEQGAPGPAGAEADRLTLHVPTITPRIDRRPVLALDVAPQGQLLAVARYGEVLLVKLDADASGAAPPVRTLGPLPGAVNAVHWSADGRRLVTASGVAGLGGVAVLWDAAAGKALRRFEGHFDMLYDAELSPDESLLATCSYDKSIRLWNVETGALLRTLEGHNGAVYDVAFSPDGKFVLSASADDTCKLWRVADGERMDTLAQPLKEAYACAFSPDGRLLLAAGADKTLRVWEFTSRERPGINPMIVSRFAHEAPIVRLAYTRDGAHLITSAEDRTLKAWRASDLVEVQAWTAEPDVAPAVAAGIDPRQFYVGRLDGSWSPRTITAAASPATPVGPAPNTSPPAVSPPTEGQLTAVAEREPNDLPAQAQRVDLPARVTGLIEPTEGRATDSDFFRFTARAGQEWVIEVNAARSGSPLDAFIEVLDAKGDRLPRVVLQAVRASYFTFRGKDADTFNDLRLFNWDEMGLNDLLYAQGEVVKLWLYPRGPDSGFMVYPGQGKRWGYYDTTPLSHALGEPCYIVEPHPPGEKLTPNGLPDFTLYWENDDDARRELGFDSRLYFTVPADGEYLLKIIDVRGFGGKDHRYTVDIRSRRPDFRVTLNGANPVVSPGSGKEFKVTAQRLDGFDGPIQVAIEGLPPGFSATTPLVIEAGQIEALGVIAAAADAPAPTPEAGKATRVVASAEVGPRRMEHDVNNLGEVKLGEKPKLVARIAPVAGGAVPLAAREGAPLEFNLRPGETIRLQVQVERQGFDGSISFGNEGAGRNLPHGVYVDNLGLNGLLIPEKQVEREFFVTADRVAAPQSRLFYLNALVDGNQASPAVLLHILPAMDLASRPGSRD